MWFSALPDKRNTSHFNLQAFSKIFFDRKTIPSLSMLNTQ